MAEARGFCTVLFGDIMIITKENEGGSMASSEERVAYLEGSDVIWDYDSITRELIIMKRPKSYVDALAGLGKEMWEKAGGAKYIEKMRAEWDE